jgi:hypothetical protein
VERIEVGYVGRATLLSFGAEPRGRIAVISPGEPLNLKDAGQDWVLNWHGVCTSGETLVGPPPLEIGPSVTADAVRRAVHAQLQEWRRYVREPTLAYVPAARGYAIVTLCRALHALATGERGSKEQAVEWTAARYPQWARIAREGLAQHRADVGAAHRELVAFVDAAVDESENLR